MQRWAVVRLSVEGTLRPQKLGCLCLCARVTTKRPGDKPPRVVAESVVTLARSSKIGTLLQWQTCFRVVVDQHRAPGTDALLLRTCSVRCVGAS